MRKVSLFLAVAITFMSFATAYTIQNDYSISSTGSSGIISYPSLDVGAPFEVGLGISWIFVNANVLSPAISIVPFTGFNIGAAFDYHFNNANGWPKPLIASLKYVIPKAGLGIYGDVQFYIDPQDLAFNLMLIGGNGFLGLKIGEGWDVTFGSGISFTPTFRWNLNVFMGLQKALISDVLYLDVEFGNYSYRIIYDPFFANDGRGVFNVSLEIVPAKWISFSVRGMDLLDDNRSLGFAAYFRLGPK